MPTACRSLHESYFYKLKKVNANQFLAFIFKVSARENQRHHKGIVYGDFTKAMQNIVIYS